MRVYVNGIDCGDGKIKKNKHFVNVLYYEAMFPTSYPIDKCIFATRFGKKCMLVYGDYSEEAITTINKQYNEWLKNNKV